MSFIRLSVIKENKDKEISDYKRIGLNYVLHKFISRSIPGVAPNHHSIHNLRKIDHLFVNKTRVITSLFPL